MVGEIQSWWLMLEVSFEHRVATVASSGVGHNCGELVRRLAPLHWDGSPNQSSETVRAGPAGPRSFHVGVPLGVRL
jgi:hypothetical protein